MNKVAVLGAGTMGAGIATVYALHGCQTALYSRTLKTLEQAKAVIEQNISLLLEEGAVTGAAAEAALSRLSYTDRLSDAVAGAWYVVETIVEKEGPKHQLYAQLDALLPPEVIIASNTSYLDIFRLLPEARLPYSLIVHWYAPAHILPLVEVVKGPQTLEAVMARVTEFHTACGKTAVRLEQFIPGFIVNRLQSAMTREVSYLIENGYCTPEDLDLAVKTSLMPRGLLLGVVQRMDFNGLDMVSHAMENGSFSPAPATPRPSFVFDCVERGDYGVKTGKGLWDYSHQSQTETLAQRDRALLKSVLLASAYTKKPLGTK